VVTNPGEVALGNVFVVDDHGTPGVPADDFVPNAVLADGFNSGDRDRDGLLDPGETWFYTWTTAVTAGQHINVATASAEPVAGGTTVLDTDPAYWFGEAPCLASLGNFVWNDLDKDGIQDAGEPGIKGVVVNLLDASGAKVLSTTTDTKGFYQFTGLSAGLYSAEISCKNFVCGDVLAGWRAALENQGSSEASDSDGGRVTHRSDPVKLNGGETNSDIDFGFYRIACDDHRSKGRPGFRLHDFGGDHKDDPHDGGSAHHKLIDGPCKAATPDQNHEVKLPPCSSWVKPFVCDVATGNPNKGIKIAI